MRAKDFKANDAQKEKAATRTKVQAEYDEVRAQAFAYLEQKKKDAKDNQRKLDAAKKQAVRTVASVMSLSTILQKGHSLGDDHEEVSQSVEHFTKCLDKFLNKEGGSYSWSAQLNSMTGVWNKLALGYKENIPDTEMSYKALNDALPQVLTDAVLPAEIEEVMDEPEPPVEQQKAEPEPVV